MRRDGPREAFESTSNRSESLPSRQEVHGLRVMRSGSGTVALGDLPGGSRDPVRRSADASIGCRNANVVGSHRDGAKCFCSADACRCECGGCLTPLGGTPRPGRPARSRDADLRPCRSGISIVSEPRWRDLGLSQQDAELVSLRIEEHDKHLVRLVRMPGRAELHQALDLEIGSVLASQIEV